MVFKRRDPRTILQVLAESFWPRGGWGRAFEYLKHRIRRLPDTPEKIGRGLSAGVLVSFTPFFGLHFILAWLVARSVKGNVLAAILGTFFGNPLTFPPIALVSMKFGHFLLGSRVQKGVEHSLFELFWGAGLDLIDNLEALFTSDHANWHRSYEFYSEVFLPYLIGGFMPGLAAATAVYLVTVPLIAAYQNARKKRLRAKLAQLRHSPTKDTDEGPNSG